jgi:hypothetical protein
MKYVLLSIALFIATATYGQQLNYEEVLQKAIAHRQTQNAAHIISWDTEHYLLNMDQFTVDQEKGQLTVTSGKHQVTYRIKILGTYDHQDSSFLWSVYNSSIRKDLMAPVSNLMSIATANRWEIAGTRKIRCTFDSAYKLAALVFYLDGANGMNHVMTNNGKTNVFFTFYEVEVYDEATKTWIAKVPVKTHYKPTDAPALVDLCKEYVFEFGHNEAKYNRLYEEHNEDQQYLDTLFANRVTISDKYWDTTSVHYASFKHNRLQAHNLRDVTNWRAIAIGEDTYVLYDEKESWGSLKTWAFKMCRINGQPKICNEYLCF